MSFIRKTIQLVCITALLVYGHTVVFAENLPQNTRQEIVASWESEAELSVSKEHLAEKTAHVPSTVTTCTGINEFIALYEARSSILNIAGQLNNNTKHAFNPLLAGDLARLNNQSLFDVTIPALSCVFETAVFITTQGNHSRDILSVKGDQPLVAAPGIFAVVNTANGQKGGNDHSVRSKHVLTDISQRIKSMWHAHLFDQAAVDYFALFLYIWEDNPGEKCALTQSLFSDVATRLYPSVSYSFLSNTLTFLKHFTLPEVCSREARKGREGSVVCGRLSRPLQFAGHYWDCFMSGQADVISRSILRPGRYCPNNKKTTSPHTQHNYTSTAVNKAQYLRGLCGLGVRNNKQLSENIYCITQQHITEHIA